MSNFSSEIKDYSKQINPNKQEILNDPQCDLSYDETTEILIHDSFMLVMARDVIDKIEADEQVDYAVLSSSIYRENNYFEGCYGRARKLIEVLVDAWSRKTNLPQTQSDFKEATKMFAMMMRWAPTARIATHFYNLYEEQQKVFGQDVLVTNENILASYLIVLYQAKKIKEGDAIFELSESLGEDEEVIRGVRRKYRNYKFRNELQIRSSLRGKMKRANVTEEDIKNCLTKGVRMSKGKNSSNKYKYKSIFYRKGLICATYTRKGNIEELCTFYRTKTSPSKSVKTSNSTTNTTSSSKKQTSRFAGFGKAIGRVEENEQRSSSGSDGEKKEQKELDVKKPDVNTDHVIGTIVEQALLFDYATAYSLFFAFSQTKAFQEMLQTQEGRRELEELCWIVLYCADSCQRFKFVLKIISKNKLKVTNLFN